MRLIFLFLVIFPAFAFAAGGGGGGGGGGSSGGGGGGSSGGGGGSSGGDVGSSIWVNPPAATKTTKTCRGVKVWDEKKNRCARPKQSSLDPDTLMSAVRELAYAGRIKDAQGVLRTMPDQNDDLVLTYWGFTSRKLGKADLARVYYHRAITRNPDNILARSYLGQGLVEAGRVEEALQQWQEILARGGAESWAEVSLRNAIRTGLTFNY